MYKIPTRQISPLTTLALSLYVRCLTTITTLSRRLLGIGSGWITTGSVYALHGWLGVGWTMSLLNTSNSSYTSTPSLANTLTQAYCWVWRFFRRGCCSLSDSPCQHIPGQDRTTELLVETYQTLSSHVKFTQIKYRHSDRTWAFEHEEVISSNPESDNIFLSNDPDLGLEWPTHDEPTLCIWSTWIVPLPPFTITSSLYSNNKHL